MKDAPPVSTKQTTRAAVGLPDNEPVTFLVKALECENPFSGTSRHVLRDDEEVEIGRGEASFRRLRGATGPRFELRVPDRTMSARHARLQRVGATWILEDLGSTNGTLLDGQRIERAPLRDGQLIEIGATLLLFRETQATAPLLDRALSLGDAVRIGEPVDTIVHGHDGILVRTRAGAYRTDHVIIAVPPVMARGIAFEPALPPVVGAALDAWESGMVVKAFARYPSPFWRDAGLSGSIMWADTRGLYVCDASPDDRHATLVVFTGGEIATRWMAEGEAGYRSIVLARLVAALGPKAAEPLDFVCRNWSHDSWSGGGYSDTVMAMEALDAEDVLRAGLPGVTFACSELSPSYPGYVEGAITSGRLQARAVIEGLARGRAPTL